jgi:hypothetical protein
MNKQDLMTCRNFRLGTCTKSDPIVLEEDHNYVQMGCKTCRGGWVVSLPEGVARARYENRIAELKRHAEQERVRRQQPVYFT